MIRVRKRCGVKGSQIQIVVAALLLCLAATGNIPLGEAADKELVQRGSSRAEDVPVLANDTAGHAMQNTVSLARFVKAGERAQEQFGNAVYPTGTITVRGNWKYLDESDHRQPVRYARVELYDNEPAPFPPVLLATTYTDSLGNYSFGNIDNNDGLLEGGLDVFVQIYCDYGRDRTECAYVTDGNLLLMPYWAKTDVKGNVPDGVVEMGEWEVLTQRGAWAIYDSAVTVYEYFKYSLSPSWGNPKLLCVWPGATSQPGRAEFLGPPWLGFVYEMRIPAGGEYNKRAVYHEYSHAVMFKMYADDLPPTSHGGQSHFLSSETDEGFALIEGWAECWEFIIAGLSFEQNIYADSIDDNDYNGAIIEGAVAEVLWDIVDSGPSDDDGVPGGYTYLAAILQNHKPSSILEIKQKWQQENYPYLPALQDIYHAAKVEKGPAVMPTFTPTPVPTPTDTPVISPAPTPTHVPTRVPTPVPPTPPPSCRVVAMYHFDEGSGSRARDSSGNGHDGTVFPENAWADSTEAKFGSSCFENVSREDSHVSIPPELFNDVTAGAIDFWFMAYESGGSGGGSERTLFSLDNGINNEDLSIWFNADTLRTGFGHDPGGSFALPPPGLMRWYHYRLEWDDTSYRIYLDGQLRAVTPKTKHFSGNTRAVIGYGAFGNVNRPLRGRIDEFRVEWCPPSTPTPLHTVTPTLTPTPTSRPTYSPTPGTITPVTPILRSQFLFHETFNGDFDEVWEVYKGSWSIINDAYQGLGAWPPISPDAYSFAGDPSWSNYTLELEARGIAPGSGTHPQGKMFIVFFRVQDASGEQFGSYYRLDVWHGDSSVTPNRVELFRRNGDLMLSLASVTAPVSPHWVRVKIRLHDNRIEVSLDGERVLDVIDETPLIAGGIGVGGIWGIPAQFDNITVVGEPLTIIVDLPGLPDGARPLEMVEIPAGSFTMGSPMGEVGRYLDWPPHEVTITRPFYMGKYEVTQAQWRAVMGSNPAQGYGTGDNYPVYFVSWNDCQEFINRLNGMGLGKFRLPSEAEWEYACRAGTVTRFSFGDALECAELSNAYCETADRYMWWSGNNSPPGAKEVGQKLPNPWGLHDMHGNVHEWCSDYYESPYDRGPQVDPEGPSNGSTHVHRGGAWFDLPSVCRSAYRADRAPDYRHQGIGFRLVMIAPTATPTPTCVSEVTITNVKCPTTPLQVGSQLTAGCDATVGGPSGAVIKLVMGWARDGVTIPESRNVVWTGFDGERATGLWSSWTPTSPGEYTCWIHLALASSDTQAIENFPANPYDECTTRLLYTADVGHAREPTIVYLNSISCANYLQNDLNLIQGTFAGLKQADVDVIQRANEPGNLALRVKVDPGEGVLILFSNEFPISASDVLLARVSVRASNSAAQIFAGLLDVNEDGEVMADALGLEQFLRSSQFRPSWNTIGVLHRSATGYARPFVQVAGGLISSEVLIDNIEVYLLTPEHCYPGTLFGAGQD